MRSLALVAVLLAGCTRSSDTPKPGTRAACTCTYLTDFDDTAHVEVDVCVESGKNAEEAASFCALQNAHNHIDGCTCRPAATACDARAKDACEPRLALVTGDAGAPADTNPGAGAKERELGRPRRPTG